MARPTRRTAAKEVNYAVDGRDPDFERALRQYDSRDNNDGESHQPEPVERQPVVPKPRSIKLKFPPGFNAGGSRAPKQPQEDLYDNQVDPYAEDYDDVSEATVDYEDEYNGNNNHAGDSTMNGNPRSTRSSARTSGRSSGGSNGQQPVAPAGRQSRNSTKSKLAALAKGEAQQDIPEEPVEYPDADGAGRSVAQGRRPSRHTVINFSAAADPSQPGFYDEDAEGELDEEYALDEDADADAVGEEEMEEEKLVQPPSPVQHQTRGGRTTMRKPVIERSSDEEDENDFENSITPDPDDRPAARPRRSGRKGVNDLNGFVAPDNEAGPSRSRKAPKAPKRRTKDDDYEVHSEDDADLEDELADLRAVSPQLTDHSSDVIPANARTRGKKTNARGRKALQSTDDEQPTRKLRERTTRPNYDMFRLPLDDSTGRSRAGPSGSNGNSQANGFLMDMTRGAGALADPNMPNMPDSDSDDDAPDYIKALRTEASSTVALANGGVNRGKKEKAPAVGPSTATVGVGTVGRYNPEAAKADADPLGVDLDVTFDQVGGLDGHINQLKEMVALPLLYPELFQQFGITPPRGVLFHGPPGTGKTLLARALAASCSTSTQKIAFFMRKGADCLSKWVGEAERQLKLLFEEAKNAQPSIIFFDEIDGLAPVRSSKQDQVHSSLVATLLALMDGMDGRGQVIVIGATNRPDSVDPALRRPGRFDREFYFPLPNKDARKKIIGINTRKWQPPLEDAFLDELAGVTKGYGGADLRALCTEAALNAIQRRYPQVYKTNDRLQLDPTSIHVQARDFMASVKKIVPSSARAASSSAQPIPPHLEPLLLAPFERISGVLDGLIPNKKTKTVLEEAEWEDDNVDGTFGKELIMQSFETLRVYRPRLLVHGKKGFGQRIYGAALLHHLEGYHVQNLDIATLLGQSTATAETMLVQMFIEAKRHQPSVLYIPALSQWSAVLTPSAKATFGTLLDSLTPSEPVIVIAFMDDSLNALDDEVKSWFGRLRDNVIELQAPTLEQVKAYFRDIMEKIRLPPDQFPDALPKRRRVLEELPKAAPLPPPAPSAAALAEQAAKDQTLKEVIAFRLIPILTELKKKHNRKATLTAAEALQRWYQLVARDEAQAEAEKEAAAAAQIAAEVPMAVDTAMDAEISRSMAVDAPDFNPFAEETENPTNATMVSLNVVEETTATAIAPTLAERERTKSLVPDKPTRPKPHWVDFELMQEKLMSQDDGYYSLRAFERDIFRMRDNVDGAEMDHDKRAKAAFMAKEATLMIKDHFQDEQQKLDFERMAAREFAKKQLSNKKTAKSASCSPNGTRASARLSGRAPEISFSQIIQNEKANGKKRSRDGSVDSGSIASDSRAAKRNKRSEFGNLISLTDQRPMMQSAAFAASHGPGTGAGTHAMVVPSQADVLAGQLEQASTIAQPSSEGLAAILNPVHPSSRSTTPFTAPPAIQESLPTPHPPFSVPEDGLNILSNCLVQGTTNRFTVEDLEHLHSMALKIIWMHRSDWDRSDMVHQLITHCSEFVNTVNDET